MIKKAMEERDSSYCQQMENMSVDDCLSNLSAALGDDQYCKNINDIDIKTRCLETIIFRQAITDNNYTDCNQITGSELNAQCTKQVISTQTDPVSCNDVAGSDQSFCQDSVAANQAIANESIEDCDNISDTKIRENCQTVVKAIPRDSDQDGLPDSQERSYGLNPFAADTDADGLSDFQEASEFRTDPRQADTDKDGITDGQELAAGSDPLDENVTASQPASLAPIAFNLLNVFIIVIVVLIISLVVLFFIIKYKK
ncbi:hypothetical protein ACFL2U_02535 [Patescibacteria group bacterium]